MKTKRFLSLILALSLCVGLLAACGGGDSGSYTADNKEFVIGVSGPLTGDAAVYGTAVKNGAQMAVDEINAAGGLNGVMFKLVVMDDQHDPSKVSSIYADLYEGGMQLSLGTVTTGPGLEFTKMSAEDNVFFLTPSASGDDIPSGSNGYQMCFADGNQGQVAANFVSENFAGQTIGVFYKADENYSKGIYDQFKKNLDSSVKVIETSFTDATATDFSNQIDTLKDCEFIFMPIYYTPASLFMTQAKSVLKATTVYYGCDGFDGIDSIKGFDINSIPQKVTMLSHFNSKATDGKAGEFITKYTEKYGSDTLNQFGASAYDCIYALYGALKAAADAGEKFSTTTSAADMCKILKKQFDNGYTYTNGVTGDSISWEPSGYVNKSAIQYVIKDFATAEASE